MRRAARAAVSVLATLALLGLVARRVDVAQLRALLETVDLRWAFAAALLGPLQFTLAGLRWRGISEALGSPLAARDAVSEYGLSSLLNQVLPGGIAGDAVRVWRRRGHEPLPGALQAAVLDRWVGLWVHVAVTVLGLLFALSTGRPWGVELAVVVVVLGVLSIVPFWRGAFGDQARRALRCKGGEMVGLSLALTLSFLLGFAFAGVAVGVRPGAWVFTAVPMVLLSMAIPLSVGGWGLREATAVALLPRLGWSMEAALAVSAVYGLSSLVGALPGGLALLLERRS